MPLTHVAQRLGFNIPTLRRILEEEGLYVRSLPTPLWTEEEVRILRRDYGKPGLEPLPTWCAMHQNADGYHFRLLGRRHHGQKVRLQRPARRTLGVSSITPFAQAFHLTTRRSSPQR